MFLLNATTDTGQVFSQQDYLLTTDLSTGLITGIVENLTTSISTGVIQSIGNFNHFLNPFFPPDHFYFLFGASARQTVNSLIIQKSDLFGLTASANNTPESLLVALLFRNVLSNKSVQLAEISFTYWGRGSTDGKCIDTFLIDIRDKLIPTNSSELPQISNTINPNSY